MPFIPKQVRAFVWLSISNVNGNHIDIYRPSSPPNVINGITCFAIINLCVCVCVFTMGNNNNNQPHVNYEVWHRYFTPPFFSFAIKCFYERQESFVYFTVNTLICLARAFIVNLNWRCVFHWKCIICSELYALCSVHLQSTTMENKRFVWIKTTQCKWHIFFSLKNGIFVFKHQRIYADVHQSDGIRIAKSGKKISRCQFIKVAWNCFNGNISIMSIGNMAELRMVRLHFVEMWRCSFSINKSDVDSTRTIHYTEKYINYAKHKI